MLKKILYALGILILLNVILYFAAPGFTYNTMVSLERWRAGLEKKSILIDDHTITYLERGTGEAILLIHGFNGDKDNWTRFARYLPDNYRLIIPDDAGFGESTFKKNGDYTIKKQAERIKKLADALNIKKFHIAGNSMGGAIAGAVALQYPDYLLSLGLFDAAGIKSSKKSEFVLLTEQGKNILVVNKPEDFKKMMEFVFVTPPFISGPVALYLGEKNLEKTGQNNYIFAQIKNNIASLEPHLKKITVPTLVLWGRNDRILDVSGAYIFDKNLPNSKLVIMESCGHIPMLERPRESADHYTAFLLKK